MGHLETDAERAAGGVMHLVDHFHAHRVATPDRRFGQHFDMLAENELAESGDRHQHEMDALWGLQFIDTFRFGRWVAWVLPEIALGALRQTTELCLRAKLRGLLARPGRECKPGLLKAISCSVTP
jgi:hypothetical protein